MKQLILIITLLILLISQAHALRMLSGDDISIDSPIDDDVFAGGGSVTINAPVGGVVIWGGDVTINAPVSGDVFVAGGDVVLNSDVGGKIVAAGGDIDVSGKAKNAVIAGGDVTLYSTTVIEKDAVIAGRTVSNAGRINGTLTVRAENFQNTGSVGHVDFTRTEWPKGLHQFMNILALLVTVGFFILGILMLKLFPTQFFIVEEEVRRFPVKNTVVGFALIIVSVIVITLIAATVIGVPVALVMIMLFIMALMLSSLFVSFALGRTIVGLFNAKINDILIFVIGFVIVSVLLWIPYAGPFIGIIVISLGFGSIFYALRKNWQGITAKSAE
jgi:hypothetical protein